MTSDPKQRNASAAGRTHDLTKVIDAVTLAVRDALRRHKQAGHAVATWRDGQVTWVPAEQIPVEPE